MAKGEATSFKMYRSKDFSILSTYHISISYHNRRQPATGFQFCCDFGWAKYSANNRPGRQETRQVVGEHFDGDQLVLVFANGGGAVGVFGVAFIGIGDFFEAVLVVVVVAGDVAVGVATY